MRLQLDSALTGTGVTRSGETVQTVPAGGSGTDSRRIGGDSAGADSIHISGPSSALNRLSADRTARIEQLTAQVQGGSYQVSGAQVSRSIVDQAVS
jgi:anti-sigma28 factor (negative regulator of flagellin synthesis)